MRPGLLCKLVLLDVVTPFLRLEYISQVFTMFQRHLLMLSKYPPSESTTWHQSGGSRPFGRVKVNRVTYSILGVPCYDLWGGSRVACTAIRGSSLACHKGVDVIKGG